MKELFFSRTEHFRHERKFYIENMGAAEVEHVLRMHPALFREIYHERSVNNIYFDSPYYRAYFDNVNGVCRRLKVRIRWYGELFGYVEKPMLELKLRDNLRVGKLTYPLAAFNMDSTLSIEVLRRLFRQSTLSELPESYLLELSLSLLNRYGRKYFLSADGKYRVTIDTRMRAYKIDPFQNSFFHRTQDVSHTILELKYAEEDEADAARISNAFPFRMTRSSKYVRGVEELLSY